MSLKITVLSFFAAVATANAQLQIGFVKTGPKVVVFGDREHPTQIFVDEFAQGAILPGGNWAHDFGARIQEGGRWITISARVCQSSREMPVTLWPPKWATDPKVVGNLMLDDDYVRSNPDEQAIGKRVDEIKKAIEKRLGHKAMQQEIGAWLKQVKKTGMKVPGTTCEQPSMVQGYRLWIGSYNNGSYYPLRNTITLYIEGTPIQGYRFRVENLNRVAQ